MMVSGIAGSFARAITRCKKGWDEMAELAIYSTIGVRSAAEDLFRFHLKMR